MAAPSNKPIGYQIGVILLFLTVVVLGTVIYMQNKNFKLAQGTYTKSEADRQKVEQALTKRDNEYEELKKLTGNLYDDFGLGDDGNTGKVNGASRVDIAKAGVADITYKAAINSWQQQVADLKTERDKQRDDIKKLQDTVLALQGQYQTQVATSEQGRTRAEKDLQDLVKKKDEEVRSKQQTIDKLQAANLEVQTELDNEKAVHVQDVKKLTTDVDRYVAINAKLVKQIDEITKTSFEVPDGLIRWVDNQNQLVWINLGEADNLPKRMTFSVYTKSHNGVARGAQDIKGAIEVTRIIDAHTAEARITHDDLYQPMAKGDPIFTPVWSAGRKENFSFIGIIDLDGDGKSDRQRVHELIASAGGAVDNEVDDEGKRIRYTRFPNEFIEHDPETTPGIDVNTKFLIIGQIPDIALAVKQEDKDRIERMLKHRKALEKEASQQGVRTVNLSDFLAWIGYQPQRRLFVPGSEKGYDLKSGQREPPVNNFSGSVSGSISGNKRLKPQSSSGQASPLFK